VPQAGSGLVASCGELNGLVLTMASVVGRSHAGRGSADEDALAYAALETGVAVALADGATSADRAAWASRRAVDAAADALLASALDGGARLSEGLVAARGALERDAAEQPDGLDAFATTLAVALIEPCSDGALVRVLSIGNTYAFVVDPEGRMSAPSAPGATFLTWPEEAQRVTELAFVLPGDATLVLTTDGLGNDLVRGPGQRSDFGEGVRKAATAHEAAELLSYHRRGSGDDRSYIAVRLGNAH
jgi:Protein phosphatase 2C